MTIKLSEYKGDAAKLDAAMNDCLNRAGFYIKRWIIHLDFAGIKGNTVLEGADDENCGVYCAIEDAD